MKKIKQYLSMVVTLLLLAPAFDAFSQAKPYNDAGFLNKSISDGIMEIKFAERAMDRSDVPGFKTLARNLIGNNRAILAKLLPLTDPSQLKGVPEQEIDKRINAFNPESVLTPSDTAAAYITGNNISDSLGSGSSGSGNTGNRDTGTMARTYSAKNNADYSGNGNAYLYNNQPSLARFRDIEKEEGKKFEAQWISNMQRTQDHKLREFEQAAATTKNEKLKMAVIQVIPSIKMQRDVFAQSKSDVYGPEEITGPEKGTGGKKKGNK